MFARVPGPGPVSIFFHPRMSEWPMQGRRAVALDPGSSAQLKVIRYDELWCAYGVWAFCCLTSARGLGQGRSLVAPPGFCPGPAGTCDGQARTGSLSRLVAACSVVRWHRSGRSQIFPWRPQAQKSAILNRELSGKQHPKHRPAWRRNRPLKKQGHAQLGLSLFSCFSYKYVYEIHKILFTIKP